MPTWPASLPQSPLQQGYEEGFKNTFIRSESESGFAKRRRRFTTSPKKLNTSFLLTGAQVTTFESFFDTDLEGGALSFTFTNPRTSGIVTVALVETPEPVTAVGPDDYILRLKLEILP